MHTVHWLQNSMQFEFPDNPYSAHENINILSSAWPEIKIHQLTFFFCAMYKVTHEFKLLMALYYYIIGMQIWSGHLFKARTCKSMCSITQNRNDNSSVNDPTKFQNCWHCEHCTYFPLSKQYTLYIIEHSAHHILSAILKFCHWQHVQTGQSSCNINTHPI
jgi:hypothetical protein